MRKRYLFALASIFAGTIIACGSDTDDIGAGDVSGGDPLFGGRCVPTKGLSTRALSAECTNTYGGHAQVVGALVDVGLVKVGVDLVNTGALPASGGVKDATLLHIDGLSGAIIGDTASAIVAGVGNETAAEAEVQALHIHLGIINVDADVVKSRSEAHCGSRWGDSLIANLRINGIAVSVSGAPNEHIVRGLVNVTINEQIASSNGMRTNALHISALGVADIVVAQSEAMISCGCSDGPDGGTPGNGSDSGTPGNGSDGGTPGNGSDGGTPGNGSDGGTPGSGSDGGTPGSGSDGGTPGSGSDGGTPGSGSDGGAPGSDPNCPSCGPSGSGPDGGLADGGEECEDAGPPGSNPDSGAPGSDPNCTNCRRPDGGAGSGQGDAEWKGGGLGAKCDDNDACATGYYCSGTAPTIK